jgi:hypothetical protein
MKPSRKPFSQRLYDDNDSAKDFLVGWLKGKYFKAEVNPDKYGIDILSNWKGPRTGIEVEVTSQVASTSSLTRQTQFCSQCSTTNAHTCSLCRQNISRTL